MARILPVKCRYCTARARRPEVLNGLVPRALSASNITAAALFRTVEAYSPTLLVDEADTFMTSDELRGILN